MIDLRKWQQPESDSQNRQELCRPLKHRTRRPRIPHRPPDSFSSGIVFLTVCAQGRRPLLNQRDAPEILKAAWQQADAWAVGRYVVMPDHIHLFCQAVRLEHSLEGWVRYWKSRVANSWPASQDVPLWQSGHWDTEMKSVEQYASKWSYVMQNPVRAGLVAHPEDWPFSGEIHRLVLPGS